MRYYCFPDPKGTFSPDAYNLTRADLFALCDEEGVSQWYVPLKSDEEAVNFAKSYQFEAFSIVDLQDCVDWGMQWSGGDEPLEELVIDLKCICPSASEGTSLKLLPGPGFGDLSHPTTRLSLKMLALCVKGKCLWDIGCGSGILSLAALKLGARSVCGIDIDPSALEHARSNAKENACLAQSAFWHPDERQDRVVIDSDAVVVMNMISSEQDVVWKSFAALRDFQGTLITSGILQEERQAYHELWKLRGWVVQEEHTDGDWMAFRLKRAS